MVQMMSQRDIDMQAEQALAKFLDHHLYHELLRERKFASFQRVTSIAQQKQGIDIIARSADQVAFIDEKAQLHYINNTRPTFAFELEFYIKGRRIEGWFLNRSLKTTHYLLLWPNAKTEDLTVIRDADFTVVEGIVISRQRIKKYLAQKGFDEDALKAKAEDLRSKRVSGPQPTSYAGIKFYVSPSSEYLENPINIVISKKILAQIADAHYSISQDGFRRI